jgi:SPP1 gp7 family putative phage head morphogenesis protein
LSLGRAETVDYLATFELFLAGTLARQCLSEHVCLAKFIPTPNGTPEELVDDGVAAAAKVTADWGAQLVKALEGASTEAAILRVLKRFETGFRLEDFATVAEDKFLRGTMLGALDSQWERENDEVLEPVKFALNPPPATASGGTFQQVEKLWEKRKVMPKGAFDALKEGTKRKAFTVARMASAELLDATHAELRRQIKLGTKGDQTEGVNLADFHKFAEKRLESAGFTPANPSHVETIFRTNIISAYSSGRFTEMRQPAVLAALPYWQIQVVKDPRTRETHRKADGIVLPASDPFWKTAYPPFGYNCRCKVCARTAAWLKRNSKSVGPRPTGLPDPGFDSGTKTLIAVPDKVLKPAAPTEPQAVPPPKPQAPGLGAPSPFPLQAPVKTAPNFTPALETKLPESVSPGLGAPSPFVPYEPPAPFVPKLPIAEVPRAVPVTRPELSPFPKEAPFNPLAKLVDHAKGSNPGGVYEGSDGVKRYVKFYKEPAQAVGEHLANSLYSDLGFGGVKSSTFSHGGSLAYASELLPNTRTLAEALANATPAQAKKLAKKALDGFSADVLTANWDAVGLELDNMLVDAAGNITRIDNGASFLTRAQGARKPAHMLSDNITEWDSFFDANKNPAYAKLAKAAGIEGPADMAAAVKKNVANITKIADAPGGWAKYVDDRAQGLDIGDRNQIVDMLERRTAFLRERADELVSKPAKVKKVAEESAALLPVTNEELASAKKWFVGNAQNVGDWLSRHPGLEALQSYTDTAYKNMNKLLIRGEEALAGRGDLDEIKENIAKTQKILLDAAEAGHALKGSVMRGISVPADVLEKINKAETINFESFTSTTVDETIARAFSSDGTNAHRVIFRIRQHSAIPVDKVSANPGEGEALLPHGTRFRVIRREFSEDRITWVDLQQI